MSLRVNTSGWSAAWFVSWVGPLVGATQAAEPSQYAQRAREVTEHIQKDF